MANEVLIDLSNRVESLESDVASAAAAAAATKQVADKAAKDADYARGMLEKLQGPELNVKLPIIEITRPQDAETGTTDTSGELKIWVNFNTGPTLVAFKAKVVK